MTEPPQFPRYADRPQDGEPYGQPQGQPYGEGLPPYGYPPAYGPGYPAMQNTEPNSMALAALISAGIGLGPLGLGLGIAALLQIRRTGETGTWMAWVGIVLGSVVTLFIVVFLVVLVLVGWYGDDASGALAVLVTT